MAVHRNVGRACIVRRSLYLADAAPFRQILGRNIGPVLSCVAGNLDQTVVGSHPQQTLGDRRLCQRKDRVVVLGASVVQSDVAARGLLLALVVAREVGTNRLPMHAAVRSLE